MPASVPHLDLDYRLVAREDGARAGVFRTPHGEVRTPVFVPVATRATLKGLTHAQIDALAPEILLANTYHLHLRPGEALIRELGGLHRFTGERRTWITDSGGYQVFSLSGLARVREDGVLLKSHLDGEPLFLGPRQAVQIQEALGADLIMAFDHCVGLPATREILADAVERTTRWARACVEARTRDDQALFGIVQGGTDPDLRAESARQLTELDLPGYAIGGLAVGESPVAMREAVESTAPLLPEDRPRYLMGIGHPPDLLDGIRAGIDMFDCVLPTRMGRRGHLYTHDGILRIAARQFETSEEPVDDGCRCEVCRTHSRAYLRHLFAAGEHAAVVLGTLHNLTFFLDVMRRARDAIQDHAFAAFRDEFNRRYIAGEAAWRARVARDPDGRTGSRRARAEQDARRRRLEEELGT